MFLHPLLDLLPPPTLWLSFHLLTRMEIDRWYPQLGQAELIRSIVVTTIWMQVGHHDAPLPLGDGFQHLIQAAFPLTNHVDIARFSKETDPVDIHQPSHPAWRDWRILREVLRTQKPLLFRCHGGK